MSKLLLTAAIYAVTIVLSAVGGAAPGHADANAPVCARVYSQGGDYQECNFYNYQQCQATVSGRGGSCFDNPTYRESLARMPQRSRSAR